jgi:ribosomal protein L31E
VTGRTEDKVKRANSKAPAERVVKDIRRTTQRHFSAEEKIRIALEGLRDDDALPSRAARKALPKARITPGSRSSSRISARAQRDQALKPEVLRVFSENFGVYARGKCGGG